ncbi:MAG: hypothetical protein BWY83_02939 [bacterium ADurb.Bin478]|nr:MAG: hypothetical protein BWY83_02939 [bacterium ADurb.Bin478]
MFREPKEDTASVSVWMSVPRESWILSRTCLTDGGCQSLNFFSRKSPLMCTVSPARYRLRSVNRIPSFLIGSGFHSYEMSKR